MDIETENVNAFENKSSPTRLRTHRGKILMSLRGRTVDRDIEMEMQ